MVQHDAWSPCMTILALTQPTAHGFFDLNTVPPLPTPTPGRITHEGGKDLEPRMPAAGCWLWSLATRCMAASSGPIRGCMLLGRACGVCWKGGCVNVCGGEGGVQRACCEATHQVLPR